MKLALRQRHGVTDGTITAIAIQDDAAAPFRVVLNGQITNWRCGSTRVTSSVASARRKHLAQVASPNPPPTTTTRPAVCVQAWRAPATVKCASLYVP
jgi:hypothetical protein